MVCDKCKEEKRKELKNLGNLLLMVMGWILGVLTIVSGVTTFYNNDYAIFAIISGTAIIALYTEMFGKVNK